ncbi:MAG: small multi-drug export protein [Planctomycetota bacterium]
MTDQPTIEEILAEAEELERQQPMLSRIHLVMPILIIIGLYVVLGVLGLADAFSLAGLAALPVGKFIILTGAVADNPLNQWQLALMVICMDTWVAYVLAYNLQYVYKIPRVGPWLHDITNYCRYWLHEAPWIRRWAITGVMLFVMFPLSGTGAPGGAILGRILGLRARVTLLAVFCGSVIGCGIMAMFAGRLEVVFHGLQGEWWFKASGIAILAMLLFALWRIGVRVSRAAEAFAQSEAQGGE